jgi:predicted amidophosphoribosyltransferase
MFSRSAALTTTGYPWTMEVSVRRRRPFVLAAHDYYSSSRVRDVAHALKRAESRAVAVAALAMARLVKRGAVLVPVPSSAGDTRVNAVLANEVAELAGGSVCDVLGRRTPVESSYLRRKAGGTSLTVREHHMVASAACDGRLYLVDNVVSTGSTVRAARRALDGRAQALVWAVDSARFYGRGACA